MRVKCVATSPTSEQSRTLGPSYRRDQWFGISIGREYVAIGLSFRRGPSVYGEGVGVRVKNDDGNPVSVPFVLFDFAEPRASRFWVVRAHSDGTVQIAHRSFIENPYLQDDLSERRESAVIEFDRLMNELSTEWD